MSKTKAQLIEELNVLKYDYQKTKDFLEEVMAENKELRENHKQHISEIEEQKRTEHLLLNETHKAKGELLKYRRRYKALLNAMTPLAAAIIFLAGMVIWLMI